MDINQRHVLISGGASGLGAATAEYLAALGAKITLLDINEKILQTTAKKINGLGLVCDITQGEAVEKAIQEAIQQFGDLRIVVNCAGVAPAKRIVGRAGPMPLDEFNRVVQINLIGNFNVLRVAAHVMSVSEPLNADNERGVIINTASVAAFDGQIGQAAYSASKGAVASMTLPAARELARFGIRVMAIAPGIFLTPMIEGMPHEVQASLAQQVPFPQRLGNPQEFAQLVKSIIENPMLNGSVIRLDGAMRMQAQ
ncbi:MAG: SDR family NAD(P)-dependent oxidoreductase [Legionellales bacterium]|nr:SDR family NAD(P)-dependent oxidoreductase [Legionellales bacterium]